MILFGDRCCYCQLYLQTIVYCSLLTGAAKFNVDEYRPLLAGWRICPTSPPSDLRYLGRGFHLHGTYLALYSSALPAELPGNAKQSFPLHRFFSFISSSIINLAVLKSLYLLSST